MEMGDTGKHPDHDFLPCFPLPVSLSLSLAFIFCLLSSCPLLLFSLIYFFQKYMAYLSVSAVPGKEQGYW